MCAERETARGFPRAVPVRVCCSSERAASAAAVLAADFWCEVVAEHAGCAADRCADKDVAARELCANCADGRARDAAFEIAIAASGQAERRNDRDEE